MSVDVDQASGDADDARDLMEEDLLLFKERVSTRPVGSPRSSGRIDVLTTMAHRGWELVTSTSYIDKDLVYGPDREHGPERKLMDVVVTVDTFRWVGSDRGAVHPDSLGDRRSTKEKHDRLMEHLGRHGGGTS